uniref:Uncharacterized protein n=1 Tax=Panagrolaimus sp. PS1159 TaxID=55785 RepID=A0AC35GMF4_9BILA
MKERMLSHDRINDNDADDSDTDSLSDSQARRRKTTPKRSATVSPAARQRFRHSRNHRRRSDVYLSNTDCFNHQSTSKTRLSAEKYGLSSANLPLRKTNSEPSVEQQQQALTVDAIRDLLDSYRALPQTIERAVERGSVSRINGRGLTVDAIRDLLDSYRALPQTIERAVERGSVPRINGRGVTPTTTSGRQCIAKTATDLGLLEVWATPRQSIVSDDDSEDELMNTDIEELRDAVESIQSLQRVLKLPNQHSNGSSPTNDSNPILHATTESSSMKGITTNLGGHPRGVMQFLPSAKHNQFQPTLDSYTWTKQQPTTIPQLLRRKASVPENYLQFSGSERSSPRPRPSMRIFRASETEPDLFASNNM